MNKRCGWLAPWIPVLLLLVSCTSATRLQQDLINDPFPDAQAELRDVVASIAEDAMTGNLEGLQAIHLASDKFTKFGPRSFDRQDVASTNESEAAFFGSVSNMDYEVKDLKIDVFGDIGIVTYYPEVTFVQDGEKKEVSGRQTLVFLKTRNGWRIVHEHGTIKK
ncbi:MAG: nuclear transport factor 2 family protein [Gemmatimonadota bacterium]|nr:nuclear transport factor 2 family protein [Gemmatimonadota bacterium]MDH5551241.1 nuclear transport factor 2 family protein [Gemmatimonadota bacterium]